MPQIGEVIRDLLSLYSIASGLDFCDDQQWQSVEKEQIIATEVPIISEEIRNNSPTPSKYDAAHF